MTPQEALVAIAHERGIDTLIAQPEMLRRHLMDYCRGGNRREFNLLVPACQSRVPQGLRAPASSVLQVDRIADLTRRMVDDHGMADEHARWAIGTWALALDVSTAAVSDLRPSDSVRRQGPERVPDPIPEQARINSAGKNLRGRDCSGQDLTEAKLSCANLNGVNLRVAKLSYADLTGVALSGATLSRANLRRAILRRAILRRADLSGATLSRANLRRAILRRAILRRAILRRADLSGAKFTDANLTGAFRHIGVSRANLEVATRLDEAKGLVDEPVLAVARPARCGTSSRTGGVPCVHPIPDPLR